MTERIFPEVKAVVKYPWLDLIRFLAAFCVLVVHAKGASFVAYGDLPQEIKSIFAAIFYLLTRVGHEAVLIFFVLSGFLVGGKAIEKVRDGSFVIVDYIADRISRIFLPLVPALLLTAMVELIAGRQAPIIEFLGNLFSLQGILVDSFGGNAPLWSLSYEVWFYVLVAVFAVVLSKEERNRADFVYIVFLAIIFSILSANLLICWCIGVFGYYYRPKEFSWSLSALGAILAVVGTGAIQLGVDFVSISVPRTHWVWFMLPSLEVSRILVSTGACLLIQQAVVAQCDGYWRAKFIRLGSIGASFSYTLYLTHYPVIQLAIHFGYRQAKSLTISSIMQYILLLMICVAVAYIIYYCSERHTMAVRTKLKAMLSDLRPTLGKAA